MKRSIALSAKDLGKIIGGANIDAVLGKVPATPDHQSGDNLQPEKLKVILFTFIFVYLLKLFLRKIPNMC